MCGADAARLAATSARSLPAMPTWLGTQQNCTDFPAWSRDVRRDKISCTVPSSCYPAPAAGRFGARESYYRLCVASTTSAAMRRAIETPRDTDQ